MDENYKKDDKNEKEIPVILKINIFSKYEKIDPNIQIIQNYFNDFNSSYISVDNRDCMFQILDRIISLNTSE